MAGEEKKLSFDEELEYALRANKAILSGLRYDVGQRMLQAQEGEGQLPDPKEIETIKKLENMIESDELFIEARKLTRRAGP